MDFKNTVIVMTSNVGASHILAGGGGKLGFDAAETAADEAKVMERTRETVLAELHRTFRPEFLNRIDETIVFHRLSQEDITEIARRMLRSTAKRMEAMEVKLEAADEAVAQLAKDGYNPKYGARPLRRAIQEKVEDAVAEQLLEGKLAAGDTARIILQDDTLCVTKG